MSKKRRTKSEKSKKKKKKKKSSESGEEDEFGGAASVEEDVVNEDSDYGTGKRSSKRNRTPKAPDTPQPAGITILEFFCHH